MSRLIGSLTVMVVGVALATTANAQTALRSAQAGTSAERRADGIHQRALGLHANPGQLEEAARLHRMEAKLRKPGDARAFDCLSLASYLMVYAGRTREARYIIEQAAKDALQRGDVHQAAKAYVEAAFIAERQGKPRDIRMYAEQVQLLVQAPGVTGAQREALLNRLSYPLAAAGVKN